MNSTSGSMFSISIRVGKGAQKLVVSLCLQHILQEKGFYEEKAWSFKSKRNLAKGNELKFKSKRFWLDNDNFVSYDDRRL